MQWIDVAGAPGAGKSTILDGTWPRKFQPLTPLAGEWLAFAEFVLPLVPCDCGEFSRLALASIQKIASVSQSPKRGIYVQAGLAQIGLEIGWRTGSAETVERFYRAMPSDLGVILMSCGIETARRRNRTRGKDLSGRVAAMESALAIAHRVLVARKVPVLFLKTSGTPKASLRKIRSFMKNQGRDTTAAWTL